MVERRHGIGRNIYIPQGSFQLRKVCRSSFNAVQLSQDPPNTPSFIGSCTMPQFFSFEALVPVGMPLDNACLYPIAPAHTSFPGTC